MQGALHHLRSPHVMVDNGLIHEEFLQIFSEVFAGRYRVPLPAANG
jgi:hypothetical protein